MCKIVSRGRSFYSFRVDTNLLIISVKNFHVLRKYQRESVTFVCVGVYVTLVSFDIRR